VSFLKTKTNSPVAPEGRPHSFAALSKNIAGRRSARCAVASNPVFALCTRWVRAVPFPRPPCGGHHFEHAQRQHRGLALAQRAVGTLLVF